MDKLYLWDGKHIELEDENGRLWRGYVQIYEDEEDSDEGEEFIALRLHDDPENMVGILAHEIKSIREIDPPKRERTL